MEQTFPVLYHHYRLREGSAGPGFARGGFGLDYKLELRNGEARASFVMDHGRFGPQGALGGGDGVAKSDDFAWGGTLRPTASVKRTRYFDGARRYGVG